MKAVYALYPDPVLALRAAEALRSTGISDRDITLISSEPLDEYGVGRHEKTLMPWLAVLGGLVSGSAGFWLASATQKMWPLPTGAMPIVTLWADGIITYELTMLGAIIATLLTLLVGARLPAHRTGFYDPAVAEGKILVGLTNLPDGIVSNLEETLRRGAVSELRYVD